MALQKTGEGLTGELAALVGVEYLGFALPERLLQSLGTEAGGLPRHAATPRSATGTALQKSRSTLSCPIC